MTFGDVAQLVTALAALGALFETWRNSRKIADVHVSINSRMDQLLKTTGDAMRAQGVKEEQDRNAAIPRS